MTRLADCPGNRPGKPTRERGYKADLPADIVDISSQINHSFRNDPPRDSPGTTSGPWGSVSGPEQWMEMEGAFMVMDYVAGGRDGPATRYVPEDDDFASYTMGRRVWTVDGSTGHFTGCRQHDLPDTT